MSFPSVSSRFVSLAFGAVVLTASAFASNSDWTSFSVKDAELSFSMPGKPTPNKAKFNGVPAMFYTLDSSAGRFVAGYVPIPKQYQDAMNHGIQTDPGADAVKKILDSAVQTFAKGGSGKVQKSDFGVNRGLPAEFATIANAQTSLSIHVYLSSKRLYVFVVSGTGSDSGSAAEQFFTSIQLHGELSSN